LLSTRNSGEGWLGLLQALTDEELEQYARLARDQVLREERWKWVKAASGFLAAGVLAWAGARMLTLGPDRVKFYALGISGMLGYWPYRAVRSRRLWQAHLDAVRAEQARRRDAGPI
jgi:hypothetical protein